uniref:Uncharacterized protein n=1 Tax=Cucumis melo TaxID=3656 RepID=A0A9I9D4Y1_CUCME
MEQKSDFFSTLGRKFPDLFSISLNKDAFVAECCCNVSQEFGSSKKCLATILETLHLWASMDDRDSGAGNFTTKYHYEVYLSYIN